MLTIFLTQRKIYHLRGIVSIIDRRCGHFAIAKMLRMRDPANCSNESLHSPAERHLNKYSRSSRISRSEIAKFRLPLIRRIIYHLSLIQNIAKIRRLIKRFTHLLNFCYFLDVFKVPPDNTPDDAPLFGTLSVKTEWAIFLTTAKRPIA